MEREEHLFEALCKKGKAYRKRRMAAGEKHGAYLSGRAVKVCKGQMSGKKKKKKNEDAALSLSKKNMSSYADKNEVKVPKRKSGYMGYSEPVKETSNIDPNNRPEFNQDKDNAYRYFNDLRDDGNFGNPNELLKDLVDFLNIEPEEAKRILAQYLKDLEAEQPDVNVYEEIDALHENETYCPKCAAKIKEIIREEIEKVTKEAKTKPAKGKRFAKKVKNPKTGRTRTVSYGQAGKAKKGGDRIRPGTAKGNAYCARSAKIKKCKNPPCANTLSRKKWKCQGSRSVK